jgi:hypothetical protein
LVASIGTGGTITGTGDYLKLMNKKIQVWLFLWYAFCYFKFNDILIIFDTEFTISYRKFKFQNLHVIRTKRNFMQLFLNLNQFDDNLFNIFLIFSSLGTWIHVFVSLTLGWGLGGEEGRHWLAIPAYI